MSNTATELQFLRFFYEKVQPCLGPADSEIIYSIKQEFIKEIGKELPLGYEVEEDPGWVNYTLGEFEAACRSGVLTDDDGTGIYMNRCDEGKSISCAGFTAEATRKRYRFATSIRWFPK